MRSKYVLEFYYCEKEIIEKQVRDYFIASVQERPGCHKEMSSVLADIYVYSDLVNEPKCGGGGGCGTCGVSANEYSLTHETR
jgi:hypothetical protein